MISILEIFPIIQNISIYLEEDDIMNLSIINKTIRKFIIQIIRKKYRIKLDYYLFKKYSGKENILLDNIRFLYIHERNEFYTFDLFKNVITYSVLITNVNNYYDYFDDIFLKNSILKGILKSFYEYNLSLIILGKFNEKYKYIQNKNIVSIKFLDNINYNIIFMTDKLKKIRFNNYVSGDLCISKNVEKLIFCNYNDDIRIDLLNNLKYLKFKCFNGSNILPKYLIELDICIDDEYFYNFFELLFLKKLIIKGRFNQKITTENGKSIFPNGLEYLDLRETKFDNNITELPNTLIYLYLDRDFDSMVEKLPDSIKYLNLGHGILTNISYLPKNLSVLKACGNKYLDLIETKLTKLCITDNTEFILNTPTTLRYLHLSIFGFRKEHYFQLNSDVKMLISIIQPGKSTINIQNKYIIDIKYKNSNDIKNEICIKYI